MFLIPINSLLQKKPLEATQKIEQFPVLLHSFRVWDQWLMSLYSELNWLTSSDSLALEIMPLLLDSESRHQKKRWGDLDSKPKVPLQQCLPERSWFWHPVQMFASQRQFHHLPTLQSCHDLLEYEVGKIHHMHLIPTCLYTCFGHLWHVDHVVPQFFLGGSSVLLHRDLVSRPLNLPWDWALLVVTLYCRQVLHSWQSSQNIHNVIDRLYTERLTCKHVTPRSVVQTIGISLDCQLELKKIATRSSCDYNSHTRIVKTHAQIDSRCTTVDQILHTTTKQHRESFKNFCIYGYCVREPCGMHNFSSPIGDNWST